MFYNHGDRVPRVNQPFQQTTGHALLAAARPPSSGVKKSRKICKRPPRSTFPYAINRFSHPLANQRPLSQLNQCTSKLRLKSRHGSSTRTSEELANLRFAEEPARKRRNPNKERRHECPATKTGTCSGVRNRNLSCLGRNKNRPRQKRNKRAEPL